MKTLSRSISKNFEKTLRKLKIKEPGAQQLVQLEIDVQVILSFYRSPVTMMVDFDNWLSNSYA